MPDRDISQYSDEELQSIIDGGKQSAASDISSVPTEELERIAGQQRPSGGIGESIAAGLRGVRETIPFAKDIGAAATAYAGNPLTGQAPTRQFEEEKRRQQRQDVRLAEQHPYAYGAGELAGVGTQLLAPEVGLVKAGMSMPAKLATSAGEGAIYGLGEGITPEERLQSAIVGGTLGAGVTGALGAASKGLEAAKAGAARLRSGAQGEAEKAIQGAMETDIARGADRLTPEEIKFAEKSGQPILPVDVGGYSLAGELRKATNISPEAEAAIYNPLKSRHIGQQGRYEQHLQDLMGHDLNSADMQESLRKVAQDINQPAYRAAYDSPKAQNIWNEELAKLSNAPAVKSAIQPAIIKAQNKAVLGEAPEIPSPFVVDSAGNITAQSGERHTLEFWDNVKKAMDDKIGALKRAGDSSWVDINEIKKKLVKTLDDAVPEYQTARSGAAAMFGADNAFDAGMNFLGARKALNAAQMKKAAEKMKPNEREVFAHGVAADMLARIRNKDQRLDISKMFDSPEDREKIVMALGQDRAKQFETFHRIENIMERAYQAVVSNSTNEKQYLRAEQKGLGKKIAERLPYYGGEAGVVGALSHSITGAIAPVLLDVAGTTAKHLSEKRGMDAAERLGEMLVSPDPAVRQQVINMIAESPTAVQKLRNVDTSLRRMAIYTGVDRSREKRKAGGRVYPAKRLTLLEKAALKAHKELAEGSKPLMDMPDESIAHQLNVAKDQ